MISFFIGPVVRSIRRISLHKQPDHQIDRLDPDKRRDDPPDPVDQQVVDQQLLGRHGAELRPLQRQRHQQRDDDRVEDDRREDGAEGAGQVHDVQHPQLRIDGEQHRRDDGEVLGDVVGDAEGGQVAAGHQDLLADLDDVQELGRVAVEVDDVGRLAGRLGAGVHGHRHVGLGQGRGVVGAVAGHGHHEAGLLVLADQAQLVLRLGLGEEVVHLGLGGDGGGGQRDCRR